MRFFNKIIDIFRLFYCSYNNKHLWDLRIGEKKHLVQDVLNNYEALIGNTKPEAISFFQDYKLIKKKSNKWIYEIKKTSKGDYIFILHFCQDNLIKVNYSYLEYK
ncbi:hypothetical protein DD829_02660 [Chryseobacterium sp. HMWF035]|nr:hypothetical protein DD829_02660 [Chryseobacterium sp. HMWF035]